MNKFTKTVAAVALSGLMSAPATAVDLDFLAYATTKATAQFSGAGCKNVKFEGAAEVGYRNDLIDIDVGDGDFFFFGGMNTGVFGIEFVDLFGEDDVEGTVIANKLGNRSKDKLNVAVVPKEAVMDLSAESYDTLIAAFEEFVGTVDAIGTGACKNIGTILDNANVIPETTRITKFTSKWNKKGTQVSVKMKAEAGYIDTKVKLKKVQAKFDIKKADLIEVL